MFRRVKRRETKLHATVASTKLTELVATLHRHCPSSAFAESSLCAAAKLARRCFCKNSLKLFCYMRLLPLPHCFASLGSLRTRKSFRVISDTKRSPSWGRASHCGLSSFSFRLSFWPFQNPLLRFGVSLSAVAGGPHSLFGSRGDGFFYHILNSLLLAKLAWPLLSTWPLTGV